LPGWLVEQLQLRFCRVAGNEVLRPAPDKDYALSEDDMRWQLEFLSDLAKKG